MSCKTLLPVHIDPQINRLDEAGCERLTPIEGALSQLPGFHDPRTVDARYLSAMADEYEAGAFYDFEEDLRSLIRYAQQHYPRLGTIAAVKEVFAALDIEATIIEWYESGKAPYLFDIRIRLSNAKDVFGEKEYRALVRLVDFGKNARSHLDTVLFLLPPITVPVTTTTLPVHLNVQPHLPIDEIITSGLESAAAWMFDPAMHVPIAQTITTDDTNLQGGYKWQIEV